MRALLADSMFCFENSCPGDIQLEKTLNNDSILEFLFASLEQRADCLVRFARIL